MYKILFMAFGSLVFSNAFSFEFESINLQGFDREIMSERQIRFVDQKEPGHVIHLQIDKYDQNNLWQEKSLKKDIESMFETRKTMYGVFGFTDVQFSRYNLQKIESKLPRLNIFGSYVKFKKKKVYFSESNIYYQQNFLQVKIIKESDKISDIEAENIIKQIKPLDLEVK